MGSLEMQHRKCYHYHGAIPNLPADMVVEIPAVVDASGLHRCQMEPLPEAIAAMLRLQGSIHQLSAKRNICRALEDKVAPSLAAGPDG